MTACKADNTPKVYRQQAHSTSHAEEDTHLPATEGRFPPRSTDNQADNEDNVDKRHDESDDIPHTVLLPHAGNHAGRADARTRLRPRQLGLGAVSSAT